MAVKKKTVKKKAIIKKRVVTKKPVVKKKTMPPKKKLANPKKKAPVKKAAAPKSAKKAPAAKKPIPAKKKAVAPPKAPIAKKSVVKTIAEKKPVVKKAVTPVVEKIQPKAVKPPVKLVQEKPKPVIKKQANKFSPIDNVPLIEPYHEKEGEDYMNTEQRQHFRNVLNRWKQELMQEVDRTVGHMKDEAANYPDPADRATQEEEFNLELRTRDRERKLIKKIDEALQRIDEQDYGYCEACGIEIGSKRLEARPTATLCIDCKTVDEIREKQLLA